MMETSILIIITLLAIIVALASLTILYHFTSPKETYLTNTTELYSLFTPYMNNQVNYRLQAIECQPEKYYYTDSSICFICDEVNACFGYSLTTRDGMEKMNYNGYCRLSKRYNNKTALSFYSYGISDILECKEDMLCKDEIKAKIKDNKIMFIFPSSFTIENINNIILYISNKFGFGDCFPYLDRLVYCGETQRPKMFIVWFSNNSLEFDLT